MDLHALGRAGMLLHRAHAALSATDTVQEPGSDRAHAMTGDRLGKARELIGQARDHALVAYALAQLRTGLPQDRPARIHDAYTALASAADQLGMTTDAPWPQGPTARLGDACQDMSRAVMLLAPFLSPKTTVGAGPHTPVRLATHLQLFAESAAPEPAPVGPSSA